MTKIVSLSEKAYEALKRLKRDGESFSDVVSRLAGDDDTKLPLLFAGKWVGDDLDTVFTRVAEEREEGHFYKGYGGLFQTVVSESG